MSATLKAEVSFLGTGLHTGRPVRMTLLPAPAGHGIVFRRTDLPGQPCIPARWDHVIDTRLSTQIGISSGASVATIEHIMAALAGTGVDSALVDLDGPEVPISDGSALRFVRAILGAGLTDLGPGHAIEITRSIGVQDGPARAQLHPHPGFVIDFQIEFPETLIGTQQLALDMRGTAFAAELADCRTFCLSSDIARMQALGLALGGSLDNAIVVDGMQVDNPDGLRRADEFVRHKMLDAMGDLALAGLPILGRYRGLRAGHRMTNLLLRKLFDTPDAWRITPITPELAQLVPGNLPQTDGLRQVG